ncbi:MAG TPA: DUF5666 domain-containing protein [Candidatus Xenobia bacterium]|nr:DUF5666 domain-containing protein [Candidatus Xenobia bacterium]
MNRCVFPRKAILFILVAFLLTTAGCGGGSSSPPSTGPGGGGGSASIFVTDQPADDVTKVELTVTGIVFNPGNVSVLPQPKELEVTKLQLKQEFFRLASNVPAGSYTSIVFTFAPMAEIQFFNSGTGSIQEVNVPVSPATETINTSFTITAGQTTGLLIDFNVPASLVVNGQGIITAIDPVMTASVVTPAPDDFDEVVGRVVSVTTASNTFVFEPFESCQQVTVSVNAGTEFEDFDEQGLANSFSSLMAGQIVEVEADLQSNGTILAEEVELEDNEVEDEAEGLIISVTRNATDEVTQFVMTPLETVPCSAAELTANTITVDVPASGVEFRIDEEDLPVSSNLFDNRTKLDVGQMVEVDPTSSLSSGMTQITAEEIKLEDQTIKGTVISIAPPSFLLDPTSDLFPDQDIVVLTFTNTEFDNPPGSVTGLATGDKVRVRGLLFRLGPGQHQLAAKRVREDP